MPINNDIKIVGNFDAQSFEINISQTLILICLQKINFIFNFFFEIL